MAESILKFHTQNGDIPVGYPGLADKPVADKTLTIDGAFADSKTVGDKFAEAEETASQLNQAIDDKTSQLKEDLGDLSDKKITKFYASNLGETHIADSDNGKIADMRLYGRSEQKSTTGAQLINTFGFKAINGVLTIDEDGVVTLTNNINDEVSGIEFDLSTLENSQYTFKNYSNVGYYVMLDSVDYSHFIQPDNSFTFTKTDFLKILGSNIQPGKSANFKCMLEKGSEATSYEPYTGGQPSPSPDYPQEIKSVVNPSVKVCGKNLLKIPESNETESVNGFSVTMNDDGSISVTGTATYNWSNITKLDNKCHTDNATYTFSVDKNPNIVIGLKLGRTKANDANYQQQKIMQNQSSRTFETNGSNEYCSLFLEGLTVGKSYNFTIYPMLELGSTATAYEPYHEQTVTFPYTLNAIPVESGGNVAINGQQYIADYVDVERGKVVRMCERVALNTKSGTPDEEYRLSIEIKHAAKNGSNKCIFSAFEWVSWETCANGAFIYIKNIKKPNNELYTAQELKELSLDFEAVYQLAEKQEIDLTTEQTQAFKELATYYPVTNISVNSEQLDSLTVFNYPISMANGWNYVKQQLNDNRDYIYDMDSRTQDIDTQAAEAYVNSEYAVALTELEV